MCVYYLSLKRLKGFIKVPTKHEDGVERILTGHDAGGHVNARAFSLPMVSTQTLSLQLLNLVLAYISPTL